MSNKTGLTKIFDKSIVLLFLFYATIFLFFHSPVEWHNDDSSYYIGSANSIIRHHTYEFNYTPQTKFPPGYPLFIALLNTLLQCRYDNVQLIIIGTAIAGLAGACIAYVYWRTRSPKIAFISTLILVTNPYFFSHAVTAVASDLPYFFATMFTILCGLQLESKQNNKQHITWGVFFTLGLVATLMTRSIGITLLLAYIVYMFIPFIFKNIEAAKIRIRTFILPVLIGTGLETVWFVWSMRNRVIYYPGQYMDSYLAQIRLLNPHRPDTGIATLSDIVSRFINNIAIQFTHFSEMVLHLNWLERSWISPFVITSVILFFLCIYDNLRRKHFELSLLYLILYLSMLFIWPFDEGQRFILPVFPILCSALLNGAKTLSKARMSRSRLLYLMLFLGVSTTLYGCITIKKNRLTGIQNYTFLLFWILVSAILILLIYLIYRHPQFIQHSKKMISERKPYIYICLFFSGCIIISGLVKQFRFLSTLRHFDSSQTTLSYYVNAAEWLERNTTAGSIVMATQIAVPHRISGMKVIPFPVTGDGSILENTITQHKVNYIIITNEGKYPYFFPTDEERILELKKQNSITLDLIYSGKNFWIYQTGNGTPSL